MKKIQKYLFLLFAFSVLLTSGAMAQHPQELPLWPEGAPTDNGLPTEREDLNGGQMAVIPQPTVTVYPASKPNGMAILMCPGGGYARLALGHEGHDLAAWMNARGITYAVLKYRMPNGHHEVPASDAEQALRILHQHAAQWQIDSDRIGIMGASAGGHLAATVANLCTVDTLRPAFQVLLYPVISMDPALTHGGSRYFLIGDHPTADLQQHYSLEQQVSDHTPEAFVVLCGDDDVVPPANSYLYADALARHHIPATVLSYPHGGHGWGFRDSFRYKTLWTMELEQWLQAWNDAHVCPLSPSKK